ncbi:MAG: ATP-binding cassette domain-containing protein, partial [Opitutaceae bacterium]
MSPATPHASKEPLLSVRNLRVGFDGEGGPVQAVDGISFDIPRGRTVGLVGESGCGKSVTALSLLRLLPQPSGKILGGEVRFEGRDLLPLPIEEMHRIRGARIGMVFQEPMTALNPVHTIGRQLAEVLRLHTELPGPEITRRSVELLRQVGIPSPELRLAEYPHRLSGGMRQRVVIAMAIACGPQLLIADEPTTALDVTIQAQILEIMARLSKELGTAVIIITHNLGVVARYA